MKKALLILMIFLMMLSLLSCVSEPKAKPVSDEVSEILIELKKTVEEDVDTVIKTLTADSKNLLSEVDSYDKYKGSNVKVGGFYDKMEVETKNLCLRLREYCATYIQLILADEGSYNAKYDALGQAYAVIYENARDEIYDEIYDGILNSVYDGIYGGVLDKAYGVVPYSRWRETRKEEYDRWSATRKKIYENWADTGVEIYEFWSGIRGEIADENLEKAAKKLADFNQKIEKLQGTSSEESAKDQ